MRHVGSESPKGGLVTAMDDERQRVVSSIASPLASQNDREARKH